MNAEYTAESIVNAIEKLIKQRPGLDPSNYSSVASYQRDANELASLKRKGLQLLYAAKYYGATAEDFLKTKHERIVFRPQSFVDVPNSNQESNKEIALHYIAGQYYPMEYRRAALEWVASAMNKVIERLPQEKQKEVKDEVKHILGRNLYKTLIASQESIAESIEKDEPENDPDNKMDIDAALDPEQPHDVKYSEGPTF